MGMIVLDTNTLIDFYELRFADGTERQLKNIFASRQYCISIVTRMEIRSGIEKSSSPSALEAILQEAACIDIWPGIEAETVRIRKTARLKLPDAIIAATAFYLGATLATSDRSGFSKVPGLDIWVPERRGG
ncbi:PIN domain-containing protein [Nostoc sp. NIES-2111]